MAGSKQLRPAVVLVTDRTLSADYKILFEGMLATMQTTQAPEWLMRKLLCPPVVADSAGRARSASISIRRVESSLLADTPLTGDDVVCTTPEALPKLLGPWVKVVGVSSNDPLGSGMSNTTTSCFWKGQLYTRLWTDRLMGVIRSAKDKFGFTVVAGGGGAWQWVRHRRQADRRGIDIIFEGYFESEGPDLFMDLIAGRNRADHIIAGDTAVSAIQPMRGSAVLGMVELSRGCGKGCAFCPMATKRMEHVPVETILSDLRTNVAGGQVNVVAGSEDSFRYGGKGSKVNFEALRNLLEQMHRVDGLRFMQIDHANISSVLQFDIGQLKEIRRLLDWPGGTELLWVNMGLESASGRLVRAISPGKAAPFNCDDWEQMVRDAAERMHAGGFMPVFSVILGLPDETGDDVRKTLGLVRDLIRRPIVVFPIFYEPLTNGDGLADRAFSLADMRLDHLELYTTCYENNFRQIPRLFADNQHAGGVPWAKRAMLQLLGRGEIFLWRRAFSRLRRQLNNHWEP